MEKIKKFFKNKKALVLCGSILVIVAAFITIVVKNSYANVNKVFDDQTVNNLTFSDATVTTNAGITTFKVQVKNNLDQTYSLKNIDIIFDLEDGEVKLLGYIGDKLNSNETKTIEASIDKEVIDITKITYKINK